MAVSLTTAKARTINWRPAFAWPMPMRRSPPETPDGQGGSIAMGRPLHQPGASAMDWPEDFPHENGNYICRCCRCEGMFWGHKRRIVCKSCRHPTAEDGESDARYQALRDNGHD